MEWSLSPDNASAGPPCAFGNTDPMPAGALRDCGRLRLRPARAFWDGLSFASPRTTLLASPAMGFFLESPPRLLSPPNPFQLRQAPLPTRHFAPASFWAEPCAHSVAPLILAKALSHRCLLLKRGVPQPWLCGTLENWHTPVSHLCACDFCQGLRSLSTLGGISENCNGPVGAQEKKSFWDSNHPGVPSPTPAMFLLQTTGARLAQQLAYSRQPSYSGPARSASVLPGKPPRVQDVAIYTSENEIHLAHPLKAQSGLGD